MTSYDLCPMCGVMREMDVTGFRTTYVDVNGTPASLLTRAYHCEMCSTLVKCDEVEDTEENCVGVLLDDEELVNDLT